MRTFLLDMRRALARSWRVLLAYALFTAWGFGCLLASVYLTLGDARVPVHLADSVLGELLAIVAAGTVGHLFGTVAALLRPRLWLAVALGALALVAAGFLVPATGPIGPFLVVAGFAAVGGWLAVGSGEVFASWVPLTYSVGAAVLWMNTHGKVSVWLTGAKFAVWDALTFAFLSGAVVLFLVYLLQRHALALALWQAASRPGSERLDLHARAGRGSWAVLAATAGLVLIATAVISPFLFRTRLEAGVGQSGQGSAATSPQGTTASTTTSGAAATSGGASTSGSARPPLHCLPPRPGDPGDPACASASSAGASSASMSSTSTASASGSSTSSSSTSSSSTSSSSTGSSSTGSSSTGSSSTGSSTATASSAGAAASGSSSASGASDPSTTEPTPPSSDGATEPDPSLPPPPDFEAAAKKGVDVARLGLAVMAWLVVLFALLLLAALFFRPARRALWLRHLMQPLWRTPPTRRVQNLWLRARIALDDLGVQLRTDETPAALARRAAEELGHRHGTAPAGLDCAAALVERLEYAGRGLQPDDERHMRAAVRALVDFAARHTSWWTRVVQGWAVIER